MFLSVKAAATSEASLLLKLRQRHFDQSRQHRDTASASMQQNLDIICACLWVQAAYSDVKVVLQSWQQHRKLFLIMLCSVHLLVVQQHLQQNAVLHLSCSGK